MNESHPHLMNGNEQLTCFKLISWTGILVGALVAIGLGLLFSLLNMGLGVVAVSIHPDRMTTLSIAGLLWSIICAVITMFIAGWSAGKIARPYQWQCYLGILHGFCVWCIAIMVTMFLIANVEPLVDMSTQGLFTPHYLPMNTSEEISNIINPNLAKNFFGVNRTITPLTKTVWAGFFIFLFGAIASCAGGYFGLKNQEQHTIINKTK